MAEESKVCKYIVQVEGGHASYVFHEKYEEARKEAIRLAKKENKPVIIAMVINAITMEPVIEGVICKYEASAHRP